ncbi:TonB-dependent receptor [Luteimonas sp. SX5]|uniref:TonB-dependent receptor n=1 Tax=Luteimonas galliterrae TaxID=2940486 RepID=A0ABT0ML60_9GAMM|nr:TonB-dependent receptor [Luteimonas galliterrae]MCL1635323.1 TonB-dependent receptor [Luteimonas galliterrae]
MARQFTKGFKRSALTVALGICFAGSVSAQSSVGSIFGETAPGGKVTILNVDNGVTREITAGSDGKFTFPQLAPGRYTVTSAQGSRDVQVRVGTGTPVSFTTPTGGGATNLGAVTVVGEAAFNPIDVSSVESTTIFSAEQIQQLPVARDITNVALLAPGTVKGDTGFGNLASFGGSSVAENGYYINGFDVTNIHRFTSYASMPFSAIAEQQVKTGGYGAEFGRSLGGVINIVTKRGTNEWHGGVSAIYSPSSWRERGKDVLTRNAAQVEANPLDKYYAYRSQNESDDLTFNLWGSGPLIKDRLFFFALAEGRRETDDVYRRTTSTSTKNTKPHGMVKLDWNITDNHLLEFTGISNRDYDETVDYSNHDLYDGAHGDESARYEVQNGGEVYIGKYTGYLTDTFTVSAMAGKLKSLNNAQFPASLPGAECNAVYDSRGPNANVTNHLGCWNESQLQIRDPDAGPDFDERKAYRLDAEWQLGDHRLRFGYDHEKFTSFQAGLTYSGTNDYYRYFTANSGVVNGVAVPVGTEYVRLRHFVSSTGSYDIINTAAYVEDNWQATPNLMLYLGARLESFENKNDLGQTFIEADKQFGPRLGFAWDVNGDSSFKVFGNAGRYFIPVASNTNIRASAVEGITNQFFTFTGIDPTTGEPIALGTQLGPTQINGSTVAPDPRTVATRNLDPMYQDEFILGFQKQLSANWTVGLRGIMRKVRNGMDDYCSNQAFIDWANDNGHPDFAPDDGVGTDMASCFVMNPGKDVELSIDLDNTGNLTEVTVPASYFGLPEYSRSYHAVEFFFERAKADNWYLQGSYTYAKSRGNAEGYVNSTLEQGDAGLTQDFDHRLFEDGAYGYLPNDRRHTLKLFGSYQISDDWRVGANFLIQSGRPVNCNGFIPLDDLGNDEGTLFSYSASSFYCINEQGVTTLGHRGDRGRTPWSRTFDASLAWTPKFGPGQLTIQLDVFNLLNSQTVTEYNETGEVNRAAPTRDPDFLNEQNFLTPRSARLTVAYEF